MADYGLKFHHAGTPEPPTLPVAATSDAVPHGWAGCSGMSYPDTVNEVGVTYGDLVAATQASALSKRDADQAVLNK